MIALVDGVGVQDRERYIGEWYCERIIGGRNAIPDRTTNPCDDPVERCRRTIRR